MFMWEYCAAVNGIIAMNIKRKSEMSCKLIWCSAKCYKMVKMFHETVNEASPGSELLWCAVIAVKWLKDDVVSCEVLWGAVMAVVKCCGHRGVLQSN